MASSFSYQSGGEEVEVGGEGGMGGGAKKGEDYVMKGESGRSGDIVIIYNVTGCDVIRGV